MAHCFFWNNTTKQFMALPVGTNGYVLTVISGRPGWAAAAGGGGPTLTFSPPLVLTGTNVACVVASASQAGCLQASDWTFFNGKQSAIASPTVPTHYFLNSFSAGAFGSARPACADLSDAASTCNTVPTALTFTPPLSVSAGNAMIAVASSLQSGALASSDWIAFNSKQPALSADAGITHQFVYGFSAPNTFLKRQPACSDLSDAVATCNALPTWGQLSGQPTTLAGYGITNGVANTTTVNGHALSANVVVVFSDLAGTLPCGQLPTLSGDASNTNCVLTVSKTGGVPFAPSATTDTTNAANISSGLLPCARLPNLTGGITSTGCGRTTAAPGHSNPGMPGGGR